MPIALVLPESGLPVGALSVAASGSSVSLLDRDRTTGVRKGRNKSHSTPGAGRTARLARGAGVHARPKKRPPRMPHC